MISKSKLAFVAAAFVVTFSVPAFAQAIDRTGTLQPAYYDLSGKQVVGDWAPNRPAAPNNPAAKPTVQARSLYNSAVTPIDVGAGTSGYDPSIASQR
jgi:hypothetical protein